MWVSAAQMAREAHVRAAAVAAEGDHVDRLVLDLALLHEGLEPGGRADGRRPRGAELGVHPRHDPRGAHVGGVGHVHAARRAEHDGARAGRLGHEPHGQRRLAPLAGAVPGLIVLLLGSLLYRLDRIELQRPSGGLHNHFFRSPLFVPFAFLPFSLYYSRTPIQLTTGTSSPSPARLVRSAISSIISGVTSRPPRPPMKLTMRGRCSAS